MIWRAIYSNCPNCGSKIGVTDYPSGVWGVAHCKKCGKNFSAARIMGKIVNVDEEEAKKIACIQTIFHIKTDDVTIRAK